MQDRFDVVVVGGGIAGSTLAAALATAGLAVLVLEQQQDYRDKVRGETIVPWGVREARRLGVEDVLLAAGGEYAESLVLYDETCDPTDAEATAIPYAALAPDVPGQLNVGHPEASRALAAHAVVSGAEVRTGVADVQVTAGAWPGVSWQDEAGSQHVACRMVVGADGRRSVVRRQLGIGLEERPARAYGAGLLVRADTPFTRQNTLGTDGDVMFLAFPRRDELTRLYVLVDIARQATFSGREKLDAFLAAFPCAAFPASKALAAGEVAGPCGGSPMTDSWLTGPPAAPGAVLVGDAAGWNDPIIGQGLSIALRDARSVAEVLTGSADWSPAAFGDYVTERAERMRRLMITASVYSAMHCSFTDEWRARRRRWADARAADPTLLMQTACSLAGPEAAPPESFTDETVAHVLAL